jgi:hypothetical protein
MEDHGVGIIELEFTDRSHLAEAKYDAVENAALLLILDGHTGQPWPAIATSCASAKFLLACAASLYALGGWLATIRQPAAA